MTNPILKKNKLLNILIIKLTFSILLVAISSLAYGSSFTTLESENLYNEWKVLTQNQDNPITSVEKFKKLQMGALLSMNAYKKTRANIDDRNYPVDQKHPREDIILSTAKLNLGFSINDWNQIRAGGFYSDYNSKKKVDLEEAYWMFSNFKKSPLYLMVGKQFLPFGRYRRYSLLPTLTQRLSTADYTTAQIGYLNNSGIYIAPYAFSGTYRGNGGLTAGYHLKRPSTALDLGLNYLYNWLDIDPISLHTKNSSKRLAGLAAHLDLLTGPFDEHLSYVTTLKDCPEDIFSYQDSPHHITGAKPRAGLFKMGYSFQIENYSNKISFSYQFSRRAYDANTDYSIRLPRNRFSATYGILLDKPLIVELEIARDQDYSIRNGATGCFDYLGFLQVTLVYD